MIRFATEQDIERIMHFINTYWKKGHILGTNKAFFKYEHLINNQLTYIISEDTDHNIEAILGYIPYGKINRDVMTVMWKVNHTKDPALGIKMLMFLKDKGDIRLMASPGSNKKLEGLYHYLGYTFGKMTQWYRLRPQENYFIAKVINKEVPNVETNPIEFIQFNKWEQLEEQFDFEAYYLNNPKPLKEKWYIQKRYFNHPIYHYEIFGLKNKNKVKTIFIFRKVSINGHNVLRLVDCIGDLNQIKKSIYMIDKLLIQYDAEYVDCYEVGIEDDLFVESGWLRTIDTDNIIPNYFEPFVQENIDIYYFSTDPDIVLFKGDGDQDRPS